LKSASELWFFIRVPDAGEILAFTPLIDNIDGKIYTFRRTDWIHAPSINPHLKINMISAILFDFGGTLDSDGQHWLNRFYRIYDQIGLSYIPKDRIKEAFYWADTQLEMDPGIRSAGFRLLMERHTHLQFEKLGLLDPKLETKAAEAFYRPSEKVLHRNRRILERLHHDGFKLGVVSNFYGNVPTLCGEAGLKPVLNVILDSLLVGLKKPDLKIFQMALDQLKLSGDQAAFVGDSFERDIVPAKALGMTTIWMTSEQNLPASDPSKIDKTIYSMEDLPKAIHAFRSKISA
jgi:putative hydrolase of the HAD superfamily